MLERWAQRVEALTPLLDAGRLLDQHANRIPYHAVVAPQGGLHTGSSCPPAVRSGLVDHVTPELATALVELLPSAPFVQLRAVGGAVNDGGRAAHERALPELQHRPAARARAGALPGCDARGPAGAQGGLRPGRCLQPEPAIPPAPIAAAA
jgi:hypothetical protein